MKNHPDHHFIKVLSAILRKGVKIGYRGPNIAYRSTNHHLALKTLYILLLDLLK